MTEEKKKQAPSPWEKGAFLRAFYVAQGTKQTWKQFYNTIRDICLEDTKGTYTPSENNIRLRCLNANKQLKKAGMKEIPYPEYVPAEKTKTTAEIMKIILEEQATIKKV